MRRASDLAFAPSDPELRLLAASCRWPASQARADAIERALAEAIDWPRFVALIDRHRVAGLVDAASAGLRGAIPSETAAAIAARAGWVARAELVRLVESKQLLARFEAAAIPVAFLKGATLSMLAFGQLGLRHCRDTDLLVHPAHALAAGEVLAAAGYARTLPPPATTASQLRLWQRTQKDASFTRSDGLEIELHWRPFVNPRLMTIAVDEHLVRIAVGGTVALPTLPPDPLFVYLCAHGAYHGWFRLKWLADIAALLANRPTADAVRLLAFGATHGVRPAVAQALVLAHRIFGATVPGDVIAKLEAEHGTRLLVATALRAITDDSAELVKETSKSVVVGMSRVLIGGRLDCALAELWGGLTNPHDLLLMGVPDWVAALYPALRMPLAVVRRARALRFMRRFRPSADTARS